MRKRRRWWWWRKRWKRRRWRRERRRRWRERGRRRGQVEVRRVVSRKMLRCEGMCAAIVTTSSPLTAGDTAEPHLSSGGVLQGAT